MRIAFAMPAYNEEALLAETVRSLAGLVDGLVIVNDGSRDRTGAIADALAAELPWVTALHHEKNQGIGGAVCTGLRHLLADGGYDALGIISSDAQCDPRLVPIFRRILDERDEVEVAKGSRFLHRPSLGSMPRFRYYGNRAVSAVMQVVVGYWGMSDILHGYLLARTHVFAAMDLSRIAAGYDLENTMMAEFRRLLCRFVLVPSPSRYGRAKSSIVYRTQIPKTIGKTFAILSHRLRHGPILDRLTPALGVASGLSALAAIATLSPRRMAGSAVLSLLTAASLKWTSPQVTRAPADWLSDLLSDPPNQC